MEAFSHLTAFLAIIPALALSRVLGGTADLLQHQLSDTPGRVRWSGLFVLTAVLLTVSIALTWWIAFNWHDEPPYPFALFCFFLIAPSTYLFVARLLIPDVEPGADVDLDRHYFAVARWVFPLLALTVLLDTVDTRLHGLDRFEEVRGVAYVAGNAVWAAALALLGLARQRAYHWVVPSGTAGYQSWLLFVAGIDAIG